MKKKVFDIPCPYCRHVNKLNYIGNEEPKKVRIQCKKCYQEIAYRDKIAKEFKFH